MRGRAHKVTDCRVLAENYKNLVCDASHCPPLLSMAAGQGRRSRKRHPRDRLGRGIQHSGLTCHIRIGRSDEKQETMQRAEFVRHLMKMQTWAEGERAALVSAVDVEKRAPPHRQPHLG